MSDEEQARELADAREVIQEVSVALMKISEALDAERFVEAAGWWESVKGTASDGEDAFGLLAAGERLRAYGSKKLEG